jgi:O-antigen/teichoic acid export membrane protein
VTDRSPDGSALVGARSRRLSLPRVATPHLAWNIVRWGVSQGATFAVNIASARALGRETFGAFGILQTSLQTFTQVASFSTASTATKYVAEFRATDPRRAGRIARLCQALVSASGLVVAAGVIALSGPIAARALGVPGLQAHVAVLGIAAFFTVAGLFHGGVLAGLNRFDRLAAVSLVAAPAFVVAGAASAFRFGLPGAVGALAGNAVLVWWLTRSAAVRELDRLGMRAGLSESLEERGIISHFALPGALTGLTAMPAIWIASAVLVRQPHGLGEMALFAAASNFRSIVLFIPGVLSGTAIPALNDAKGRGDVAAFRGIFRSTLGVTVGVTGASALAISLGAPLLLPIYGADFGKGALALAILMGSTVLDGASGIMMGAFQSTARMWTFLFAVVLPRDLTLVTAAALLAPAWGAAGLAAAYATSSGVAVTALALLTARSGVLRGRSGGGPSAPKPRG